MGYTKALFCLSVSVMSELFVIIISTILVNNLVLVQFLGLCPFMGVSSKLDNALAMAMATTFVLTLSSLCSYLLYHYALEPLGLEYLKTLTFIMLIAVVVSATEMLVRMTSPFLHRVLGIFLPLITTNCAVLGVALLNIEHDYSLVSAVVYGFAAGLGFSLAMILFAALRERIQVADVPQPFQGAPISLITAGLMSLAFMGFSGVVNST